MKKIIYTITLVSLFSLNLNANEDLAKEIFTNKCASCHSMSKPKDTSNVVAPPMKGVLFHMNEEFLDKEDKISHINDFVLNPTKSKAICKSVKRFGLMPSQKGLITKEELDIVAKWLINDVKAGHGNKKKH